MYCVIGICAAIACMLGFVIYLLNKHEKLGKYKNETKLWQKHNQTIEIIRKEKAAIANMSDDAIDDIVRKNSSP